MNQSSRIVVAALCLLGSVSVRADLQLSSLGTTDYVIVSAASTPSERHAVAELQRFLHRVTGARFAAVDPGPAIPPHAILLGSAASPFVDAGRLSPDEVLITTRAEQVILAGGGSRGTLYAVYRFLQELGCRWWAPNAESIPRVATLTFPSLTIREKPAFVWRDVYTPSAADRDWAARNFVNGTVPGSHSETGGGLEYAGFVHTFRELVPPEQHFKTHPEWYSLVGGRRTAVPNRSQLCLSNAELRRFVASQVRERLRAKPSAQVTSVSQNDGRGFCECDACKRLYGRYGTHSGALLEFVNDVAALVEPEFPTVVIETLAYVDTRRPPRDIKPRHNVAVALCCIECDAGVPLDHPRNAAFAADAAGWRGIAPRLHAWEYAGNYNEYMLPHPNWFVFGRNLRFFQSVGVKSVFLLNVSPLAVGELQELRAWLLARLAWNPQQNAEQAIDEFLAGYYGAGSAKPIRAYLDLMARAAASRPLGPYNSADQSAFVSLPLLAEAERLWQQAVRSAANNESLRRIRRGHASVRYAWLVRWVPMRREAAANGLEWPLPGSRRQAAMEWLDVMRGSESALLEEFSGHLTVKEFARLISVEPVSDAEQPHSPPSRQRRIPDLAMPQGFILISGLIAAVAVVVRLRNGERRRWPYVLLAAAIAFGAAAVIILQWREAALTARFAAGVVLLGACSLLCSGAYLLVMAAALSKRSAIAFTAVVAIAIAYVVWAAQPYAEARLRRDRTRTLRGARLARANLTTAILHGRDLREADLYAANAAEAIFNFAVLDGADLRNANLQRAMLIYTSFRDTDLRGADLREMIYRDPTHTLFRGAWYDATTRFPKGFEPRDWDMRRRQ